MPDPKTLEQNAPAMPPSIVDGLVAAIKADPEMGPRWNELEEIDKEVQDAVQYVDLDIAFSPVILHEGGTMEDAVKVDYKGEDGRYVISSPFKILKEDEMKVARARYLIMRGKAMQPGIMAFMNRKHG